MEYRSINPYSRDIVGHYEELTEKQLQQKLEKAQRCYKNWKREPLAKRQGLLLKAAANLRQNADRYARLITAEMGKLLKESQAEVEKCAWVCEYYAENVKKQLQPEYIATDADESFVSYEPLGCVMAIMPWNFPFWQVFRFAAPNLAAGNVGVLKHAHNVFGCGEAIEEVFRESGFPEGAFQNLVIGSEISSKAIESPFVQAVTLTGSERAGVKVASLAGQNLKKTVLELGGSNAFIVLPDADIDQAVQVAVKARMQNAGQSCIAAKRFILVEEIADEFTKKFHARVQALVAGDPVDDVSDMGPLAREDLAETLQDQVARSIEQGAHLLLGGKREHAFYAPTILENVKPGMPAFKEETFGPVAALVRAKSTEQAIELANATKFGLGDSICTGNTEKAKQLVPLLDGGAVFFNELVKSDPRLPFGGTKASGYGRELSLHGIREFVNAKTVYIKK